MNAVRTVLRAFRRSLVVVTQAVLQSMSDARAACNVQQLRSTPSSILYLAFVGHRVTP